MAIGGGSIRVGGVFKSFDPDDNPNAGLFVRVAGDWKPATGAWVRVGGVWKQWYPKTGAPVDPPPVCSPAGTYEPSLVGGGGPSGGNFDMTGLSGCGVSAVACKIAFGTIPGGTSTPVQVVGNPSGTTYRTITITDEWSNRTIYFDMQSATAVSQFESGAADGYRLTGSGTVWVNSTRLRVIL